MERVQIQYASDVLCIWAYVTERRIDELIKEFGESIELKPIFLNVFGNVQAKLQSRWANKGGLNGYAAHVTEVANRFEHLKIHPRTWLDCTPQSSLGVHLFLRAIGIVHPDEINRAASKMRKAFFVDQRDISQQKVQFEISDELGIERVALEKALFDGSAHAAMANDIALAQEHRLQVSPTLLFNEGRQRLTGNVGFRVIEANVRELLHCPSTEASWC